MSIGRFSAHINLFVQLYNTKAIKSMNPIILRKKAGTKVPCEKLQQTFDWLVQVVVNLLLCVK